MPALRLPGRKGTSSTGKALGRDLVFLLTVLVGLLGLARNVAAAGPETWRVEWPRTDFSKHGVPLMEIRSGGPPKDGIPAIDLPQFEQLRDSKAGDRHRAGHFTGHWRRFAGLSVARSSLARTSFAILALGDGLMRIPQLTARRPA